MISEFKNAGETDRVIDGQARTVPDELGGGEVARDGDIPRCGDSRRGSRAGDVVRAKGFTCTRHSLLAIMPSMQKANTTPPQLWALADAAAATSTTRGNRRSASTA